MDRYYSVSLTYSSSTITTTVDQALVESATLESPPTETAIAAVAIALIAEEFMLPVAMLRDYADLQIEESWYA
jgi:hypothetical protein